LFEEAIDRIESQRKGLVLEEHKLSFGHNKSSMYTDFAVLKLDEREDTLAAFELLEAGKSRALLDMLGHLRLESASVPEDDLAKEAELVAEIRAEYQALLGVTDEATRADAMSRIEMRRKQLAETLDELAQRCPDYVALRRGDPITFRRTQALLS